MQAAYASIGRAVMASQALECVVVSIFEFFKLNTEPGYFDRTKGYIPEGAYKQPLKNIVKLLSSKGSIAPDLESRLETYIENRHALVHRLMHLHGWPEDNDAEGFRPIEALASQVEVEAKQLLQSLCGYMVKYAEPGWASANSSDFQARMQQLFHRAHIDG